MGKINFFKRLFSDSLFYGLTNYFSVFVSIILLPIYTRILSKSDYGILDIFNTWNNLFLAILPLGIYSAILRFYPEYKNHRVAKNIFLNSILTLFFIISIVFVLFMLLFKSFILSNYTGLKGQEAIFYLSIFIVCFTLFFEYYKTIFRIDFNKWSYLIVSLLNFIILATLGFVLVYYYGFGIKGFFVASFLGLVVSTFLGFILLRQKISIVFNGRIFKKILNYSIHFVSVFFLFKITDVIDRTLLYNFISLESVGEYAIAIKVGGFYKILLSAVAFAWMPYVLSMKDEIKLRNLIKSISELFILISGFIILTIILFQKEIIDFFAPGYEKATFLIPIILLYLFINGFVYFFTLGIQIKKYTHFFTIAAIFSVVVNIITSILLLHIWGEVGIALGSLFGAIIWVAILFWKSQQIFKIEYDIYHLSFYLIFIFISVVFYYNLVIKFTLLYRVIIMFFLVLLVLFNIMFFKGKYKIYI